MTIEQLILKLSKFDQSLNVEILQRAFENQEANFDIKDIETEGNTVLIVVE